uniref:Ribonuclease H-like domain-containing protein n=1 Tax=Tanacetum cinerariifolium TaxID=118510 RepID=A0A6L2MA36_TANCI|nr:ribonuclease H-like domain-containing protein [Tanacetum cinerariifolium]
MKIEQYLAHTDYALWEVILNGNSAIQMTKYDGEGLDKGYDRFQRLLSLLEIHRACVSTEDANQKFIRSLPSAWSNISLIMRNKPGIDNLDIDDIYNNLKVYEADIKGFSGSSSNSQNVNFVSIESTNNTNELNAAYSVSIATGNSFKAQEQIDQDDLEEIDLKWQVAMYFMRVKRFYKKTGRKLEFVGKEPVGFDKTNVACFNCLRRGHFSRDCRTARNSRNMSRDVGNAGYRGREEEATDFALMAFISNPSSFSSSNSEVQSCSKQCVQSYEQLKILFDEQHKKLRKANLEIIGYQYGLDSIKGKLPVHQQNEVIYEEKIRILEYDVKDKSNLLKYTQKLLDEALREKEDLQAKLEKFETYLKNLTKLFDSQISAKIKTGLGYDSQFNEKEVLDVKEEEVTEIVLIIAQDTDSDNDSVFRPTHIPAKIDFVKAVLFTKSGRIPVSAAKPKAAASTSATKPVNTARPKQSVNFSKSRSTFHKSHSPIRRSFYDATTHSRRNSTERVNTAGLKAVSAVKGIEGHLQQALKNKGIVDSGCSRHMTRNKAYLADYQEINDEGFAAFDSSRGKITGKVSTRNQTDKNAGPQDTNGNAGTQDNVDPGKEVFDQHYIMFLLWSSISFIFKSSDDKAANDKPKDDTGSKTIEEPINKEDQAYRDELDRIMSQVKEASDAADTLRKEFEHTLGTFSTSGPSSPYLDPFISANTLLQFDQNDSPILDLEDIDELRRRKAIGTKWVYKNRKDKRGILVRSKSRLVAQGHRQEEGIDYDEVFAHMARIEAIRIFLAFASFIGFIIYQMDVKSSFLYGTIEEEVYMSSMRELTFFLGLLVKQSKEGIFISQDKYVVEILKKFDFSSVKTAGTPIKTRKPLVKDEEVADVNRIFRYLKGQPKLGLCYPRDSPFDLEAYLDSDYAGANLDRKSTTGEFVAAANCH